MTAVSLRCLCVVACLAAVPAAWSQSGYGAIKRLPAGYFDPQDWSLLRGTLVVVLEDESAQATRSWSNAKSGHSGTVTALRAFRAADGRPCKKVRIDNSAGGFKSSAKYDVCLHEDGTWRETESGASFAKAPAP